VDKVCVEAAADTDTVTDGADVTDLSDSSDSSEDTDEPVGDDVVVSDEDKFECNNSCVMKGDKDCTNGQIRTCVVDDHNCLAWGSYADCPFSECESATRCKDTVIVQWGTQEIDLAHSLIVDKEGNAYVTGYTTGALSEKPNAGGEDAFLTKIDNKGNILWTKQWGTSTSGAGNFITSSSTGDIYVTGYSGDDAFLTKWTGDGEKKWEINWGTPEQDYAFGAVVGEKGNIYVTGFTAGSLEGNTNSGLRDIFLSKFKSDGTKVWSKQWGTSSDDTGYDLAYDAIGDFVYLSGHSWGGLNGQSNYGQKDNILMKIDTDGILVWTRQWGTDASDYASGIALDSAGNIYVVGQTEGALDGNMNFGGNDIFLTKFSSEGSKIWTKQWGTGDVDGGYFVSIANDDSIYITGSVSGSFWGNPSWGKRDLFLAKIDSDSGEIVYSKQWGTDMAEQGHSVHFANGKVYITGVTGGNFGSTNQSQNVWDVFLLMYAE